jgi:glutamine synthetase
MSSYGKLTASLLEPWPVAKAGEPILAEYVWIGGMPENFFSCVDLRSKTMTLPAVPKSVADLRIWNYDGSSTNQAPGHSSEVLLRPAAIFKDPFRGGSNILVLCDTMSPDGTPLATNSRAPAKAIFDKALGEEPWFGIEQEYTLFKPDGRTPLGFPDVGLPEKAQGPYYCGSGAGVSFGRNVAEAHYKACVLAGLKIAGVNAEVMPGQWEYQIGPSLGIESGDHMVMSRYLMQRICEDLNICVTFDPKPRSGDWNGAGCHTNYSTKAMRAPGGYDVIITAVEKLAKKHMEHIAVYGEGNDRRLTGAHETAPMDKFSYGVGNRGCSIRIPTDAEKNQCGYFEDRRPASNMDPYKVTAKLFETTCL